MTVTVVKLIPAQKMKLINLKINAYLVGGAACGCTLLIYLSGYFIVYMCIFSLYVSSFVYYCSA